MTARLNFWPAAIGKSKFVAIASSWAKSRACCCGANRRGRRHRASGRCRFARRGRLVAYVVPRDGQAAGRRRIAPLTLEHAAGLHDAGGDRAARRAAATAQRQAGRPPLPAARKRTARRGSAHVAPARGAEQALAEMWRELLNVSPIGRHDHFFELGGHSLLAMQLVARIRALWEIELPLHTVFERPRLVIWPANRRRRSEIDSARLATGARWCRSTAGTRCRYRSPSSGCGFSISTEPDNPFYNLPTAARLVGPLDPPASGAESNQVIERHEGLRTVFIRHGGQSATTSSAAEAISGPSSICALWTGLAGSENCTAR